VNECTEQKKKNKKQCTKTKLGRENPKRKAESEKNKIIKMLSNVNEHFERKINKKKNFD
jgi:hypothetical protein